VDTSRQPSLSQTAAIGIIANPVSARDLRRIVTNASNLQIAERANIVLRLLSTARRLGVERVAMMPDRAGLRAMLTRHLGRETRAHHDYPALEFVDMPVTSTVEDTVVAARAMREAGVRVLIVLGGDGTHRAVARACGDVPIVGLSTGTNNAFPEMREPTVAAMAAAMLATGRVGADAALMDNKAIEVTIEGPAGTRRDIAIVDAVIAHERHVGARALWQPESLAAAYLTFADPQAIGFSAIGGLLQPIARSESVGLAVQLEPAAPRQLLAPIAPGLLRPVGIADWHLMHAGEPLPVRQQAGVVALDGEREMPFEAGDTVHCTLRTAAFRTLDIPRCLHAAVQRGLFFASPDPH
jgi:predicted polyphosphate/ATP-dependent NAD kinase